jgi:quercetin dioxygenase-like cupin family protein
MKMEALPFTNIVWTDLSVTQSNGESGTAASREVTVGDMRIRLVEFSPGYKADHWCSKGHVVFVLEGELSTTLEDGRTFETRPGNLFVIGDDRDTHRAHTSSGAKVFIVD